MLLSRNQAMMKWELQCLCLEKWVRSWEILFCSAVGMRVRASSGFLLFLCLSTSPCKLEINLVLPMRFLLWGTADVWINHVQQTHSTEHSPGKGELLRMQSLQNLRRPALPLHKGHLIVWIWGLDAVLGLGCLWMEGFFHSCGRPCLPKFTSIPYQSGKVMYCLPWGFFYHHYLVN